MHCYFSSKRPYEENVVLLLNGAGYPVTTDTEKSELFSVVFASDFMTKVSQTSMFSKRA